jgi:hypothetical protein
MPPLLVILRQILTELKGLRKDLKK